MVPVAVGNRPAVETERIYHYAAAAAKIPSIKVSIAEVHRVPVARAVEIFADNSIHQSRVAQSFNPRRDGEWESVQCGSVRNGHISVGAIKTQSGAGVCLRAKTEEHATNQGGEKPETL